MLRELYEDVLSRGFFGSPGERPLLLSALEEAERLKPGSLLAVQLPTGYGKTAIPHVLALAALADGHLLQRSIHVLPLRSIADDVWSRFVDGLVRLGVDKSDAVDVSGLQMMGHLGSPFFNRIYVATTFDTFSLSCFKLPPAELPSLAARLAEGREVYGHFEVSRGAILESYVVFDEPHILAESGSRVAEVYVAITHFLACMGVPSVHMTATLPKGMIKGLEYISTRTKRRIKFLVYGADGFRDKDFENAQLSKNVSTRVIPEDSVESVVREATEKWDRVLIVVNTVERAIATWKALRKFGAQLVHGKMTAKDRQHVLSKIKGSTKWVLVATQVVEAGVNLSAQCLVTDAAPPTSLVQRAGRVARFEDDREGEILVVERDPVVYDEGMCGKTLQEIKRARMVYWRLPKAEEGIGYQELLDRVGGAELPLLSQRLRDLLSPHSTPKQSIMELIKKGLPRELAIMPALVADEPPASPEEYERRAREDGLGLTPYVVSEIVKAGFKVRLLIAEGRQLKAVEDNFLLGRIVRAGPAASLLMMLMRVQCLLIGERAYRWLAYGEDGA